MKPHRKHHGVRRASRLFWYRQTGGLTNTGGAMGAPNSVVLFDSLQFLPDPINQRADVNDDVTVMHQRFNYCLEYDVTVGGGTSVEFVAYCGIYVADRNAAPQSAAYSTATNARTDWLDSWIDVMQEPAAVPGTVLSQATGQASLITQRVLRTKRKVQSEELVWFSVAVFPVLGTAPTTWSTTVQFQHSVLLKKGS